MHKYRPSKPPKVKRAPNMSYIKQGTSKEELDLHKTINLIIPGVETVKGDRTILEGREIDIYIPRYRLGIEYDGLAFHSDNTKDPNYHLWKTVTAEKKGVRLIHIWSDLWNNRRSQVTDYLSKTLGRYQIINYKDCAVGEVSKLEGAQFLNSTHILGNNKQGAHYIGIYYNNYLMQVAEFKEDWTYLQEASRNSIIIEDGLHQIFAYIFRTYNIRITKAEIDRSIFDGNDLKLLGFKSTSCSRPNSVWTKDFKTRKLQENLTDQQLATAGYHRFYDCGILYMNRALN